MNKTTAKIALFGIAVGLIIISYGLFNMKNSHLLSQSLIIGVAVIYVFLLPNTYVVFKKSLRSKLHSKAFSLIVLLGYVLAPIFVGIFYVTK